MLRYVKKCEVATFLTSSDDDDWDFPGSDRREKKKEMLFNAAISIFVSWLKVAPNQKVPNCSINPHINNYLMDPNSYTIMQANYIVITHQSFKESVSRKYSNYSFNFKVVEPPKNVMIS